MLLVCVVFSFGLFHLTFQTDGRVLYIGSKAWSDFGAHIPLIRSFSLGNNWPPEYPLFAGEPIRYHYLFYAAVGLLERVGLNLGLALNGLSAFGLGLLLWMLYRVAKLIFRSRLAGWLAIWFALTNSSLSALVLAENHGLSWFRVSDWQSLWTVLMTQTQFASFGPWDGNPVSAFWTLNIFTNQRHLGLSLGLVWWVIWPLLKLWWEVAEKKSRVKAIKKSVATATYAQKMLGLRVLVMAVFPLLHQAGALLTAGIAGMLLALALLYSPVRARLPRWLLAGYVLGVAAMGLVLIQFVPASHEAPQLAVGFLAGSSNLLVLANYWWWNLGFGLGVWLLGLVLPQRGRLLLWLVTPFFIAANLWQFSPDMINNHKFVNFFIEAVAIVAAGWLAAGWERLRGLVISLRQSQHITPVLAVPLVGLWLAVLLVFGVGMSFSGIVDILPILNDRRLVLPDWRSQPVSVWLLENTAPDARLLTTTYLYHPGSLVGRKLYLDYGYFAWSLGYPDATRRALLPELFGDFTSTETWCARLAAEKIDVVLLSPSSGEFGATIDLRQSYMARQLSPTIITDDGYTIYQLRQYCH